MKEKRGGVHGWGGSSWSMKRERRDKTQKKRERGDEPSSKTEREKLNGASPSILHTGHFLSQLCPPSLEQLTGVLATGETLLAQGFSGGTWGRLGDWSCQRSAGVLAPPTSHPHSSPAPCQILFCAAVGWEQTRPSPTACSLHSPAPCLELQKSLTQFLCCRSPPVRWLSLHRTQLCLMSSG